LSAATSTEVPRSTADTSAAPTTVPPTTVDSAADVAAAVQADFGEALRLGRAAQMNPFDASEAPPLNSAWA
jgi:hypothetical protein